MLDVVSQRSSQELHRVELILLNLMIEVVNLKIGLGLRTVMVMTPDIKEDTVERTCTKKRR